MGVGTLCTAKELLIHGALCGDLARRGILPHCLAVRESLVFFRLVLYWACCLRGLCLERRRRRFKPRGGSSCMGFIL